MPIWKMKRRSILTKRRFNKIKRRFVMSKRRFGFAFLSTILRKSSKWLLLND